MNKSFISSSSVNVKVITIFYGNGTKDIFIRHHTEYTFESDSLKIFKEGSTEKITIYFNNVNKIIIKTKEEFDQEAKNFLKGD